MRQLKNSTPPIEIYSKDFPIKVFQENNFFLIFHDKGQCPNTGHTFCLY